MATPLLIINIKKMNNTLTAKERAYLGLVKELPCSVCDSQSGSEAHHVKQHAQYTAIALCVDCHRNPLLGIHGQKRAWAIHKMDEIDALNVTIQRVIELLKK
jgi:hypothetical protein